jgi:deoxyribodipyrimidine photolyase
MSVIWFRKCLRVHDNPSLIAAIDTNLPILPIFILDPNFIKFGRCGVNRWNFL